MSPPLSPRVIDGRVTRRTSNSLKMSFQEGAADPLALAVQGSEDGKGSKLGVLFGFKNGGPGKHGLTYEDGRKIVVQSREKKPTLLTAPTGAGLAEINRGDTSTAVTPDGRQVLHFAADPTEPMTVDIFRIVITDATGGDVGRLHVIRKNDGWKTLSDVLDSAWNTYVWWDRAGAALPLLVLGTRLILLRDVDPLERDVLLGACVDLAIGLRPYIKQMN